MVINQEAEQSLIGCLLVEGELVRECILQPKHFFDRDLQALFETIKKVDSLDEPIDVVSILTHLDKNRLSSQKAKNYISMLINSIASTEPFKTYEKYILEAYKIRTAKELSNKELRDTESISKLIQDLSDLEQENYEEEYNHKETLTELHWDFETKREGLTGIDTGYRDLNAYLDGHQPGDLIVVAARPSVGKTAYALNLAQRACQKADAVVPIFSLEMPVKQLLTRMVASVGNIDSAKLRNPVDRFEYEDWSKLTVAEGQINNMNLHIYDKSGQTVPYIRSKVRGLRKRYPNEPMLVVIDYLQLIRSDKRFERRDLEVGEMTRTLKEMAKDLNVAVILLSQLSRGVESRQDKRPMMSDIRDSGSIEQDADVVEFLYRPDYYDKEEQDNIIEVIIAKQRNGPVGTVQLAFIKEYNSFLDLEYRHDH